MTTATLDLDFCPRLRAMIQTGEARLPGGESIRIRGASTINNLQVIRHLVLRERPRFTLEIGLACGASALAFLGSLTEIHRHEFGHTAIDPFQETVWRSVGLRNIEAEGWDRHFTYLDQESAVALPRLWAQNARYGLIYVDGSHLFEDVFVDFFFGSRLLELGGIILFDDCTDRHVRKMIRFIDRNYSQVLRRTDVAVGPESIKRRVATWAGMRQLAAFRKVSQPPREWNATFAEF